MAGLERRQPGLVRTETHADQSGSAMVAESGWPRFGRQGMRPDAGAAALHMSGEDQTLSLPGPSMAG